MISGLKVSQGCSPLLQKRTTGIEFEMCLFREGEILADGKVGLGFMAL